MARERVAAGHSPLTFLYAKLFLPLAFLGERGLRLGSALASGAAVLGVAALACRLGLRGALVPVAAAAALCPYWQLIGTEYRYTMPLVAAAAWLWWAAVAFAQEGTPRRAATMLALALLLVYTHGSASFTVMAVGGFLLASPWMGMGAGWRRAAAGGGLVALALAAVVPLMVALKPRLSIAPRRKEPAPFDMLHNMMESYFSNSSSLQTMLGVGVDLLRAAEGAVLLAGVAVVAWPCMRSRGAPPPWMRWLLAAALGFCGAQAVYSATVANVQGTLRYAAALSVPMVVLVGALWHGTGGRGRAGIAWRAVISAMAAALLLAECANPGPWHRETVKWLASVRTADEPVVAYGRAVNLMAFRMHAFPQEGTIAGLETTVATQREALGTLRGAWGGADCGFLLQYRGEGDFIDDALDALEAEGFLRGRAERRASRELRVIAVALTDAGLERIAAIPGIPMPWMPPNRQ